MCLTDTSKHSTFSGIRRAWSMGRLVGCERCRGEHMHVQGAACFVGSSGSPLSIERPMLIFKGCPN